MGKIRFGPAGKPITYKGSTLGIPRFLSSIGLDAFEYEAVRGVKISEIQARKLGEEAERYNIKLSLHAPYFINLSSDKPDTIEKSKQRLIKALKAAYWMKAYVVVFHPGYYLKQSHEEAFKKALDALRNIEEQAKDLKIKEVYLGAETTGKISELGSLEEVVRFSQELEIVVPVIDWAHLYARSIGRFVRTMDDVLKIIEKIEKEVGKKAIKPMHTHFSKIMYKEYGEKEHVVLSDKNYGPEFEIVCQALLDVGVDAVIISESPVLEQDALLMKKICEELKSLRKK